MTKGEIDDLVSRGIRADHERIALLGQAIRLMLPYLESPAVNAINFCGNPAGVAKTVREFLDGAK